MGLINFNLPNIDINTSGSIADIKKELKIVKEYLYQLTEQLKYTLMNLDDENLSGEFVESVDKSEEIERLRAELSMLRLSLSALGDVKRASIIASVNASTESEKIGAAKVNIGGYSGEIPGLSVTASNLVKENYASGKLYLLGVALDGSLKLCELSIHDGGTASETLTVVPVTPN
jgi:hypothetical protein